MSAWIAAFALARHELRRTLSLGRWIPVILFCAMPIALMAFLTTVLNARDEPRALFYVSTVFLLRLTPMAAALLYGLQTTASELNEPTSTFVFSSVLPRPAIFMIKWAVVTLVISVHVTAATAATQLAFSTEAAGAAGSNLLVLGFLASFAAAIWTAYFMAFGYWVRWPLSVSLGICLVLEFILGAMPFDISAYSVYQALRAVARETVLVGGALPGAWLRKPGGKIEFLESTGAIVYLSILLAALLALGVLVLSRRPIAGRQTSD